jgi:putative MATE family efflux protein
MRLHHHTTREAGALLNPRSGGAALPPLFGQLLTLAPPVVIEHFLHLLVGLTDTWVANHLPANAAAGTAAVGTIGYFLWFIGLTTSACGTGATALIARAKGAHHRSLANSVCGQSIAAMALVGLAVGAMLFIFAAPLVRIAGLGGDANALAYDYMRLLAWSVPFSTVMFVANACLRGAGDTLTPAISMLLVDGINMFFTYALGLGAFGLPAMGFMGIAIGTIIAYIAGGMIQFGVLLAGRGGIRLHLHRMRPHWLTLKRILRIGIPSGVESMLVWISQFAVLHIINGLDLLRNIAPAAHNNAVRLEAFSYMIGFAISAAAATMVGQSLGARNPRRASHAAYLCFALGGAFMTTWGLIFIFAGGWLARWISGPSAPIAQQTAMCLFITGFVQLPFAASIIFSGALRGAGDTMAVMVLNLASICLVRVIGVVFVVQVLHMGLAAVWIVLCIELFIRGLLMYLRFLQGAWRTVRV